MNRLGGTALLALACAVLVRMRPVAGRAAVDTAGCRLCAACVQGPRSAGFGGSGRDRQRPASRPARIGTAGGCLWPARAGVGCGGATGPAHAGAAAVPDGGAGRGAGARPVRHLAQGRQGLDRGVLPGQWGQRFYFSLNTTHGIGEGSLFGNQMGGFGVAGRARHVASLRRYGTQGVQLVAHNSGYLAEAGTPPGPCWSAAFPTACWARPAW